MKATPPTVAFREVRHFKPDDWLHCEPVSLRAESMDWTIPAHRHEGLHQFMLLDRGEAEVVLDEVPQRVRAPAVLMVAPACVHAFRFDRGSAGRQVTVPSARLREALSDTPSLVDLLPVSRIIQGDALSAEAGQVTAMGAALAREFDGDAPGRSGALRAHLVLLVTWFLRHAAPPLPDDGRTPLRDALPQRFRALVEIHLRRHPTLPFYAKELRVSPDHLSRICRATLGQSALDLLHDRMVLEARRLLAYTEAPVAKVAADLGFDDPSYFSRFFARRAGQSPQAYRVALRSGRALPP